MIRPSARRAFYVATFPVGQGTHAWSWEVRRKRKPMGIKLAGSGFRSSTAAAMAGRLALEDFFNGLAFVRTVDDEIVNGKHYRQSLMGSREQVQEPVSPSEPSQSIGFARSDDRCRSATIHIINSSRDGVHLSEVRLSLWVALEKARNLASSGWTVVVSDADGNFISYDVSDQMKE